MIGGLPLLGSLWKKQGGLLLNIKQVIKIAHIHEDGKECFTTDERFKEIGIYILNCKEFIIGYKTYTANWYCYDPQNGDLVATFSTVFYDVCIKQHRIADLKPDPNCN